MEDLRLAIIVLGVFAIVGVLLHGIWTIRKNAKQAEQKESDEERSYLDEDNKEHYVEINADDPLLNSDIQDNNQYFPDDGDELIGKTPLYTQEDLHEETPEAKVVDSPDVTAFDDDGIGEVRVVENHVHAQSNSSDKTEAVGNEVDTSSKIVDSPEPEVNLDMPEPPSSLLKKDTVKDEPPMIDTSIDIGEATPVLKPHKEPKVTTETRKVGGVKESLGEKAKKLVGKTSEKKSKSRRQEPKIEKDQIRLDLDDAPKVNPDFEQTEQKAEEAVDAADQEVLILSVKLSDGSLIKGADLLPLLLTLGFKFGEHNMFHRHANSNGKGPKLFSLANMFNPGTFDIDNMEKFTTAGVSLFMILPIEADPHQVFNMMHNAARKLADEFGAQILDGRRSVITKQSLQQYFEKIREFERKRMIKRA